MRHRVRRIRHGLQTVLPEFVLQLLLLQQACDAVSLLTFLSDVDVVLLLFAFLLINEFSLD